MIREGEITVGLTRSEGALRAAISSSRVPLPPALLRGKSPAAVAELLPRLFAVCALAQGSAAAAACDSALGRAPDPAIAARRAFLSAAEAVREHLMRLVLGAAEPLGEAPGQTDLDRMRDATTGLRQTAGAATQAAWREASGTVTATLAALIDAHLHRPEATGAHTAFMAWLDAARSPFARLCRKVIADGDARLGADEDEVAGAGDLDTAAIAARLLGPDGAEFALRPCLAAHGQETTAFARRRGEPLLASLAGEFGDGLLTRLVARQIDAVRFAESLPALAAAAESCDRAAGADAARGDGDGAAAVETARGRLIHAVRLRDGAVDRYRILAPTEWNFHPTGPVARRLTRLGTDASPQEIGRQARLLIDIFDPCIPYSLRVQ